MEEAQKALEAVRQLSQALAAQAWYSLQILEAQVNGLLSSKKHSTNPKQAYARSIRFILMPPAHCLHSCEKVLASKGKWSCTQGVTAYEPAADNKAGSKSKKKGKGAGTYIASGASQLRANPCSQKQVAHKAP